MAKGWAVVDKDGKIEGVYPSKKAAIQYIDDIHAPDPDYKIWLNSSYDVVKVKLQGFKKKKDKNVIIRSPAQNNG